MKILILEHPRLPSIRRFNDIANTPLWSCLMGGYAAAALFGADHEVTFLDHARPGITFDDTTGEIHRLAPDLLCINAVYFWEKSPALFEFIAALKTNGFDGHINLFGFFPTLVYRKILENSPAVDSIAVGEFENTLVELAWALDAGKDISGIQGLADASCLADSQSRMRRPEKDPDQFAFPWRGDMTACSPGNTVSILASRGCYNHCSFCPVPSFYNQGPLWRGRSPENVAREMQMLCDQGVSSFYFCDPNFIGPGRKGKQRTLALMDLIRPMKIRFGMETRPQDLDEEIMEALVNAGFETLLVGVESGSTKVLSCIDKASGPAASEQAIALCRKFGIEPEIGFLMFVPDSHLDDLKENLSFLMKNQLLDRLDRTANLLCHSQIVLAGTPGYDRFENENRLIKTGIFDFEAGATFLDKGVEQVARLLTHACHGVLRHMSDSHSPIYWEKENPDISQAVNDYLVNLAPRLIREAALSPRADLEQEKQAITTQLAALLS